MKIGDSVKIHSKGTKLKEGTGQIVDILKAGVKYPLSIIHAYYQFKPGYKGKPENACKVEVDRLVIQRDKNIESYLIVPLSARSRGHVTLS